jgi:type VI protein secretion system component Hcp
MRKALALSAATAVCVAAAGWSVPAAAKSKVKFSDISITKKVDKSSPALMKSASPQGTAPQKSRR